jgi:hypothetical protein
MLHSVLEHAAIFPYCLTSLSYFINFHFQRFGKIEPKQKKSNKQSEIAFLSNIEIIDKQLMFFYEFDQKNKLETKKWNYIFCCLTTIQNAFIFLLIVVHKNYEVKLTGREKSRKWSW